jgi:PHD/YefM family antitoxin component YafN of YafNO toxin-antitoxin module
MIETIPDTHSLAVFGDDPAKILQQLKATHRSITLTVDGKPAAILQDPAEYQRLLDLAAMADVEEDLRQSLEDVAQGRTQPAREVFAELREEYGIRG